MGYGSAMTESGGKARAAAARVLGRVLDQGESLATALPTEGARLAPEDRPLVQEICYGVLRLLPRLEGYAKALLERPIKRKERPIHHLLLVGLYQLEYLDIPPHAAVSATVEASVLLERQWARGLVNAVLRGFQRRREELLAQGDNDPTTRLNHPRWLLTQLTEAWPDDWEQIATQANNRPPMTLRVNLSRGSRADYLTRLEQAGIAAQATCHAPSGITLERPLAVERLPGFSDGDVSVQDEAAQLAAPLLEAAPGMRVLDACAAPGGKSGHLLELTPGIELTALDLDASRLARVGDNLARLQLQAKLQVGDGANPSSWWDGRPFDRILLDAPCSGTGVIRRHPDIKWLRRATDIPALETQQAQLLAALWPLLAPGGLLVYATCSILPAENSRQIAAFLRTQRDAQPLPIVATWGRESGPGRQILPGENGMDGFFYARIAHP